MGKPHARGRNRPSSVAKAEDVGQPHVSVAAGTSVRARFSGRSPVVLVLLGGLLMGLTPDPVNAWPLAWIALVPLWRVVIAPSQPRSQGSVFLLGFLWSGLYHGIALSWITALHPLTWMGVPWIASVAIALFAWAFITGLGSVTFGLWAVLFKRASDRCRLNATGRILVGTALWCALETILSWGPLYWPSLSYTQSPHNLWILHLGQIAGPMAVTGAIVAVNGCWAEFSLRRAQSSLTIRSLYWQPALAGLALFIALHGIGWGLYGQPLDRDPQEPLRIGLVQGNVPTRIKLTPAGIRRAAWGYANGYRTLVEQGAEAVLTPEGAIPEIWTRAYQARSPIRQAVLEENVVLWLGTFRPAVRNSTRELTQSLITLDDRGQVVSQYNKVKLVPLGEYIPFQAVLGRLIARLSPVSSSLLAGSPDQVFETPFGRAIIGICYESAYSELFRKQAAQGGAWIMTASNNDPYPPRMMRQHHAQDVMRAIESDRWSVRVTNTGISGVVTPHGNTLWLSEPNQYVTHLTEIYRRQSQTLYVRWGNWLTYALGVGAIGWGITSLRTNTEPTGLGKNKY
ncbi:MAG: apolipoprotein N-acyltransferase [Leptolyngbya sp. SIO1E4]|nr:apolipoprotein N-acyltransferase [Leptolyngbya sp. SIO1E4]